MQSVSCSGTLLRSLTPHYLFNLMAVPEVAPASRLTAGGNQRLRRQRSVGVPGCWQTAEGPGSSSVRSKPSPPTTAEARAGDTCRRAGGESQIPWGGVGLEYSNWQETDSWAFC